MTNRRWTPDVGISLTVAHHTYLLRIYLCAVLGVSFNRTKGSSPNLFQHGNAPMHKAGSMNTWLDWPAPSLDLNRAENLSDEPEHQLRPRPPLLTSVLTSLMLLQQSKKKKWTPKNPKRTKVIITVKEGLNLKFSKRTWFPCALGNSE